MTQPVKTVIDGKEYLEGCSFEELSQWSASRWLAGQGDAAINIEKRALALLRAKDPKAEIIRDDTTGLLSKKGATEETKVP